MDRIANAAVTAGLGEEQQTHRVNAAYEHHVLGPGILALIFAAGLLAGHLLGGEELILPTVIVAIIGLLVVIVGLPQYFRGRLFIHHFEHGIVMERTKGRIIAARYSDIHAELRTYQTPEDADNAACDYVLLQLDFPGGERCVIAEREDDQPWVLTRLGTSCSVDAPQSMNHELAEKLLSDHPWN